MIGISPRKVIFPVFSISPHPLFGTQYLNNSKEGGERWNFLPVMWNFAVVFIGTETFLFPLFSKLIVSHKSAAGHKEGAHDWCN